LSVLSKGDAAFEIFQILLKFNNVAKIISFRSKASG
jgi:hypothetical protein